MSIGALSFAVLARAILHPLWPWWVAVPSQSACASPLVSLTRLREKASGCRSGGFEPSITKRSLIAIGCKPPLGVAGVRTLTPREVRLWHTEEGFAGGVRGIRRSLAVPIADIAVTTPIEGIIVSAPVKVVVVCLSKELVRLRPAQEGIAPGATKELVGPAAALEDVIPLLADEPVIAWAAQEGIAAGATKELVTPTPTLQEIIARLPKEAVAS